MGKLRTKNGDVFGSYTVIQALPKRSLCECICGIQKMVLNGNLRYGSCTRCRNCANKDIWIHKRGECREMPYILFIRLKTIAYNAIARCTDSNLPSYKDYGERGITVHKEWLDNILLFVKYLSTLAGHDNSSLMIDRVDNNKGYEPGNLRFSTRSESMLNRRPGWVNKLDRNLQGTFKFKGI